VTTARVDALEKRLAEVEKRLVRLDEIEREVRASRLVQDPDRALSVGEVAALINRSPKTILQNWLRDPEKTRRWKLNLLLRRDVGGRYFSSPRMVAIWTRAISEGISV
jgi:hypothetical protein